MQRRCAPLQFDAIFAFGADGALAPSKGCYLLSVDGDEPLDVAVSEPELVHTEGTSAAGVPEELDASAAGALAVELGLVAVVSALFSPQPANATTINEIIAMHLYMDHTLLLFRVDTRFHAMTVFNVGVVVQQRKLTANDWSADPSPLRPFIRLHARTHTTKRGRSAK